MSNVGTQAGSFSIALLFENLSNALQIVPSLKEKGLEAEAVVSAAELIQLIAGRKLDLVCLSVNHASTNSLVQVLKVKTNVEVLVFGEDSSSATAKNVLKTAADYQVSGAVTSYNIWLKIGHLVKEKNKKKEKLNRAVTNQVTTGDDGPVIVKNSARANLLKSTNEGFSHIKSRQGEKSESQILIAKGKDSKELIKPKKEKKSLASFFGNKKTTGEELPTEPLENILKDDAPASLQNEDVLQQQVSEIAEVFSGEKSKSGKGKIIKSAGSLKSSSKSSYAVSAASKNKGPSEQDQIDREINEIENLFFEEGGRNIGLGHEEIEPGKKNVGKLMLFDQEKKAAPNYHYQQSDDEKTGSVDAKPTAEELQAEQLKQTEEQFDAALASAMAADSNSKVNPEADSKVNPESNSEVNPEAESSYETDADKIISIEAARLKRKQRKEKKDMEKQDSSVIESADDLGFQNAFKEAVVKAGESGFKKTEKTGTIGIITKIALIPVENPKESGFLLIANGQNGFSTKDEITVFKNTIQEEMSAYNDVGLELGEIYNIETREVNVSDWADKSSQFSFNFENPVSGEQILVCFLRKENLFPSARKNESHNMHQIEVFAIPPKTPIDFNAYLFLERNEKMLPYVRNGGSLTAQQIDRLCKCGFRFLYIKEGDVQNYYSFYFSQFLNQDFHTERKLA